MGEVTSGATGSASRLLLPELGRVPGHVFWRAAARVAGTATEVLPPEVDVLAYAALAALSDGARRSQQELADAVAVSRTTMVKLAADLAADGRVVRERNPDDRRSYALTRTRAGTLAVRRAEPHVDRLDDAVCAPCSPAERERLRDVLARLATAALPPGAPAEVTGRVCLLVPRVHGWLYREFGEALDPAGLEPRHVGALLALRTLGPVSQVELARAVGVSPASAVLITDELEERALVERRRSPHDRRHHLLHLTPEGPSVLARAREIGGETAARLFGVLGPGEMDDALELLRRIVTAP